jgi:flagellar hook-associated protein 2
VVLSDGTKDYLSLTNRDTGYPLTGGPSGALSITESSTGLDGKPLGLVVTNAVNAVVEVDGLTMTRTSNEIADAVPGARLSLKSVGAKEDLVLGYDVDGTQKNIQSLVDAYNSALSQVQRQLNVARGADRSKTLAGDSVVRNLQAALQRIASTTVSGLGSVRTLTDLGVQTNRDGSMSIDSNKLGAAIARDPAAVDALFNTATTGVGAVIKDLVTQFTQPSSGLLSSRRDGLNKNIRQMDTTLEQMNTRLASFKQNLIAQFTAMESVVSGFKSIGNYLANNPLPKIGSSS